MGPDYLDFMRRLGMSLEPGSWFYPEDAGCVGWSAKAFRPFILAESWDGIRPTVRMHPRTTTGSGVDHPPHAHSDRTCHLNCQAQVVERSFPVPGDCLEDHFECLEPDDSPLLKQLGIA